MRELCLPVLLVDNVENDEVVEQRSLDQMYQSELVFATHRMTVTSSCNMKLHRFPLDTQDCSLQLASCKLFVEKEIALIVKRTFRMTSRRMFLVFLHTFVNLFQTRFLRTNWF